MREPGWWVNGMGWKKNAGDEARQRRDRDQRDRGLCPPLHRGPRIPRPWWPFERALDREARLASQGDALAHDNLIALLEREARIDALIGHGLQVLILVLTLPGLYLIGDADPALRWAGAWVSLAAQPFWLADTWRRGQVGMFVVALVYSALWLRMLYTGW